MRLDTVFIERHWWRKQTLVNTEADPSPGLGTWRVLYTQRQLRQATHPQRALSAPIFVRVCQSGSWADRQGAWQTDCIQIYTARFSQVIIGLIIIRCWSCGRIDPDLRNGRRL